MLVCREPTAPDADVGTASVGGRPGRLVGVPYRHVAVRLADRLRPRGCVPGYAAGVSAERDELRRLVEELSEDRVPAVLAEARRQSGSVPTGEWPPPWFGSFASGRSDLGSDHEDLLAEGFGRS